MSTLADIRVELTQNLKLHLQQHLPNHSIAEAYHYAIFPPGKLLRPLLVKAIWSDIGGNDFYRSWGPLSPHSYLASLIEFHHAYTLIHDDLPCMDDDNIRRGKPSTHVQFGEWKAILVGDGLLNLSYSLLSHLPPQKGQRLLRFLGHKLGPQGLIHGQILDMETQEKKKMSFPALMEIHRLKTANLMQCAVVGSYLLLPEAYHQEKLAKDLQLLCNHLGVHFQLLDDLQDLIEKKGHEKEINPFIPYPKECIKQLIYSLNKLDELLDKYRLQNLRSLLEEYWDQNSQWLEINCNKSKGASKQLSKLPLLKPLMSLLNRLNRRHGR